MGAGGGWHIVLAESLGWGTAAVANARHPRPELFNQARRVVPSRRGFGVIVKFFSFFLVKFPVQKCLSLPPRVHSASRLSARKMPPSLRKSSARRSLGFFVPLPGLGQRPPSLGVDGVGGAVNAYERVRASGQSRGSAGSGRITPAGSRRQWGPGGVRHHARAPPSLLLGHLSVPLRKACQRDPAGVLFPSPRLWETEGPPAPRD